MAWGCRLPRARARAEIWAAQGEAWREWSARACRADAGQGARTGVLGCSGSSRQGARGALWGGVSLQEDESDLGVEALEDGAEPVGVEEDWERAGGGDPGLAMVVPAADQGLEGAGDLAERLVAIGAQEVGQAGAVAAIGLGARGTPTGTPWEGWGSRWPRSRSAGSPRRRRVDPGPQAGLGGEEDDLLVDDGDVVALAGPIQPTNPGRPSLGRGTMTREPMPVRHPRPTAAGGPREALDGLAHVCALVVTEGCNRPSIRSRQRWCSNEPPHP
jgi:hypothetical protein